MYLCYKNSFSQTNLVANSSFELYDTCVYEQAQINYATGWIQPTQNTPDYFHECYNGASPTPVDVPDNFEGYQFAKSGNAYAGVAAIYSTNGRDYIGTELTNYLEAGRKYKVEFYISLSDYSRFATDRIGIFISDTQIINMSTTLVLLLTPQIENGSGNVIRDTLNWTKISGIYKAQGGEKFITIGNFYPDSLCTIDTLTYGTWSNAYYYIDDVSVLEIDTNVYDISVFPNPNNGSFTVNYNLEEEDFGMFYLGSTEKVIHGFSFQTF